jgi:hypothetical protein
VLLDREDEEGDADEREEEEREEEREAEERDEERWLDERETEERDGEDRDVDRVLRELEERLTPLEVARWAVGLRLMARRPCCAATSWGSWAWPEEARGIRSRRPGMSFMGFVDMSHLVLPHERSKRGARPGGRPPGGRGSDRVLSQGQGPPPCWTPYRVPLRGIYRSSQRLPCTSKRRT